MIDLLANTLGKILERAERDTLGGFDDPRGTTWEQLRENGLLTPFQHGLERWTEAAELIRAASTYALGLPLTEQIVSSYLAQQLEVSSPGHLVTLADPIFSDLVVSDAGVTGKALMVPHAAVATHLWVEAFTESRGHELVLIEMRGVEADAGENVAREPRDALSIVRARASFRAPLSGSPAHPPAAAGFPYGALLWLGALARSIQMAGLAEQVLSSCLEHARTRVQFGRAIGSFQAVQQELAALACEVAALNASVGAACGLLDRTGVHALEHAVESIAASKIQAGSTARRAVEVGHAVHAAIGFTQEHRLHRYTQRLLSYRAEFGAERVFARLLGARAREAGPGGLWAHLTHAS